MIQVQITKVPKIAPKVESKPRTDGPKWRNQVVVRSTGKSEGYVYNDWRNW